MIKHLKLSILGLIGLWLWPLGAMSQVQMGGDLDGENAWSEAGYATAISADGNRIIVGARFNIGNGNSAGHARVYQWNGSNWIQLGADIDALSADDRFGSAVSISADGSRVAIGAPQSPMQIDAAGYVQVFEYVNGNWTLLGSTIVGGPYFSSGMAVSLSANGNRVAIGAPAYVLNGVPSRPTRVFDYDGSDWVQMGSDIADGGALDNFGSSLALSGDGNTLIIGVPLGDFYNGLAKVYRWNGADWVQLGEDIDAPDPQYFDDRLGSAVAITYDGNRIAAGAPRNDNAISDGGRVLVFDWDGSSWIQLGAEISGGAHSEWFGSSVSLSTDGSTIAVGAPFYSETSFKMGRVKIFKWSGSSWNQFGLDIHGEAAEDESGVCVSLSGDGNLVAIGAHRNDGFSFNIGHVRVFDLTNATNIGRDLKDLGVKVQNLRSGHLIIQSPEVLIESLSLFDVQGQRIPAEISLNRHEATIYSPYKGLVIVQLKTKQGLWMDKIVL